MSRKEIEDINLALEMLGEQERSLNAFIRLAQECLKESSDEPDYLSFWTKLRKLEKMRRDNRFKQWCALGFLVVRKAEEKAMKFFV